MKNSSLILLAIFGMCGQLLAQTEGYAYRRALEDITGRWHRIELPDGVFGKTASDFHDLRLMGFTEEGDTIEAPYLFEVLDRQVTDNAIEARILNRTRQQDTQFFTFSLPEHAITNRLYLYFEEQNFDWRVRLEGSHDQREWFEIVDDYRILSIKNGLADYTFSEVHFPEVEYRYLRLSVPHAETATLEKATVSRYTEETGQSRAYALESVEVQEEPEHRRTVVDLTLPQPLPIAFLHIEVDADYDYYRPITIQYLSDSVKRDGEWEHIYRTVARGTLSSLEKPKFYLGNKVTSGLRILIQNQDNAPLSLKGFGVEGNVHQMTARFLEKGKYFLYYGKPSARHLQYELAHFQENIPDNIPLLTLGKEEVLEAGKQSATAPLFENQLWLWAIIFVVIAVLGGFAVKMLK